VFCLASCWWVQKVTHLISVLYVLPVENVPPVRHRVLSLVSFWILPSAFPRVHHLDCRLSRRPDVVHFAVICTRCRTKYGALSLRDDALIALWHPSSWMLFVLGHRLRDWRGRKKCGEILLVKTRRWPIASRSVSQLAAPPTNLIVAVLRSTKTRARSRPRMRCAPIPSRSGRTSGRPSGLWLRPHRRLPARRRLPSVTLAVSDAASRYQCSFLATILRIFRRVPLSRESNGCNLPETKSGDGWIQPMLRAWAVAQNVCTGNTIEILRFCSHAVQMAKIPYKPSVISAKFSYFGNQGQRLYY